MFYSLTCLISGMEKEIFVRKILPLRGKLSAYARRFLQDADEAEDIVQEVFLKLWSMRDSLDGYRSIEAFSMKITKNLSLNRLKIQRRNSASPDFEMAGEGADPQKILEYQDSVRHITAIINTLPRTQQAILRMKHMDELETSEIAEITGSNIEAVRVNLSRARKKVKELFLKIQDHGK